MEPTTESSLQMTVAARVAEQLRAEIRDGDLAAGEPLRQNDVAARLGVSSTPVREAFHILERLGLVEREGRRGVRVFRPSVDDLINSYGIRGALESYAARLAAERLDPAGLASLRELMTQMHAPDVPRPDFLSLNTRFHSAIGRASGNPRLAELIATEQAATTSYVTFLGVDTSSAREAESEHAAILAALAAGDATAAQECMSEHLFLRARALEARLASG